LNFEFRDAKQRIVCRQVGRSPKKLLLLAKDSEFVGMMAVNMAVMSIIAAFIKPY
jgi:hypothetical protein